MGNTYSTKKTNTDILENINKMFGKLSANNVPIESTLEISCVDGDWIVPNKNRYAELEKQVGGEIQTQRSCMSAGNLNAFFKQFGGSNYEEIPEDDVQNISDLDMDELADEQVGGANILTSDLCLSQLPTNLSMTSPLNGGCEEKQNVITKIVEPKEKMETISSLSLFKQEGGCSACGGKPSEENILPIFSQTSGTEYYGNMQKENRYT